MKKSVSLLMIILCATLLLVGCTDDTTIVPCGYEYNGTFWKDGFKYSEESMTVDEVSAIIDENFGNIDGTFNMTALSELFGVEEASLETITSYSVSTIKALYQYPYVFYGELNFWYIVEFDPIGYMVFPSNAYSTYFSSATTNPFDTLNIAEENRYMDYHGYLCADFGTITLCNLNAYISYTNGNELTSIEYVDSSYLGEYFYDVPEFSYTIILYPDDEEETTFTLESLVLMAEEDFATQ